MWFKYDEHQSSILASKAFPSFKDLSTLVQWHLACRVPPWGFCFQGSTYFLGSIYFVGSTCP
jgi:hypothetical protein